MHPQKITAIFDQQAATYDQQWSRLAPINAALHLLTGAALAELPANARVLCVGAGTGAEILYLADRFPGWHFTAVEPSAKMLAVCRQRAETAGIAPRCAFHFGYLDSLPPTDSFDAATAFLVSQFILDPEMRTAFFQEIADRLRPGGWLVSSDLAGDLAAPDCQELIALWFRLMRGEGVSAEQAAKMREAYARDVAVRPPEEVRGIIQRGGFEWPVPFFQAGMIHAWVARRSAA